MEQGAMMTDATVYIQVGLLLWAAALLVGITVGYVFVFTKDMAVD